MAQQTPVWALPYPALTDPADISQAVPPLAQRLETVLTTIDGKNIDAPVGILATECPVWDGANWVRSSQTRIGPGSLGSGAADATKFLRGDGTWQVVSTVPGAGSITSAMIQDGTLVGADMAVGAVSSREIADASIVGGDMAVGAVTTREIADGTLATADYGARSITYAQVRAGDFLSAENVGTVFPTGGLFNGYRFTLLLAGNAIGGYVGCDFVYRPDIDATYPWVATGAGDMLTTVSGSIGADGGYNFYNLGNMLTVPRAGWWHGFGRCYGQSGGGGGGSLSRLIVGGSTYSGVAWGNQSDQGFMGCFGTVAAGGVIYFQGQTTVNATMFYSGVVGGRPMRLA